jgi:hypothetical protein
VVVATRPLSVTFRSQLTKSAMRKTFMVRFTCLTISCLMAISGISAHPKMDPIKFTLSTDATTISLDQEFEIKITASYQPVNPNLVFVFKGATTFRLKVVFPEGFRQTGGTYSDYIGTDLSSSKQTVSYTIKGKFVSPSSDGTFLLLRSNQSANSQSDFILAGRLGFRLSVLQTMEPNHRQLDLPSLLRTIFHICQ